MRRKFYDRVDCFRAVARAEPVFGFGVALVLALLQ
jgi:hypothetical protein